MNAKIYVNYKAKRGRRNQNNYEKAVKEGLLKFINDKAWNNAINKNENKNNNVHLEGAYLCHGIWNIVMENKKRITTKNQFYWMAANNTEILFHFDIMNNPKTKSCGLVKNCTNQELQQWKKIYHSIGNMTPIPWFRIEGNRYIDCQALHNALDERWDLFLKILKNNWNDWYSKDSFKFKSYMLITCQQIYYTDIYNDFKNNIKEIGKINKQTLENWMGIIKDESQIISFPKYKEYKEESIASLIINLIKIRCHIIGLILQEHFEC